MGLLMLAMLFSACSGASEPLVLRLATTTSVDNSGLLAEILPLFEEQSNIAVEVIAVGTGQALALGEAGNVDAVIVHAPDLEDEFVANGFGTQRHAIMFNDFIIVGPTDDPADIANASSAPGAFTRIAQSESTFVSRGDNSGTHFLEQIVWGENEITPSSENDWYLSIGQGMGASLNLANEEGAYILTDRGTFLAQSANLPYLTILFGGNSVLENPDSLLYNYYSVIPINPELHPSTQTALVDQFVNWLVAVDTQAIIGEFGVETFGQPLFYPNSDAWNASQ
jgi:tungstate transport system substrate-binding protein